MFKTSRDELPENRMGGRTARWALSRDSGGATGGVVGLGELSPGEQTPMHRHPNADEAIIVLEGTGVATTSAGDAPAKAGTVLFAPRGSWHTLRAGDDGLKVMMVYGGIGHAKEAGEELPDDGPLVDVGIAAKTIEASEATDHPFHDPDQGFHHISARWLVDGDQGAHDIVVGQSSFAADGGLHALHRHPDAEEFLYLLVGEGTHIDENGDEHPVKAGEITLVSANEWHGFRNTGDVKAIAFFGYLGANSLAAGGYELP
jgi:quercetin dioxygenase-like cupin family protein